MSEQLALALDHRPALGREDFLVGPANREAIAWIDAWPAWPACGLVIVGPAASGKSHLAEVWRARSQALARIAAQLHGASVDMMGGHRAIIIDRADEARDETALFHLHNALAERGGHGLWLARRAVRDWGIALADLRSRLLALPSVTLAAPGDDMIVALLVKLFADRQIKVEPALIEYLSKRIERSARAAQDAVDRLDRAALARGRPVTVPLAREVIEGLSQ